MAKKEIITREEHLHQLFIEHANSKPYFVQDPYGKVNRFYLIEEYEEGYDEDWSVESDRYKTGSLMLVNYFSEEDTIETHPGGSSTNISWGCDLWEPEAYQLNVLLGVHPGYYEQSLFIVMGQRNIDQLLTLGYTFYIEHSERTRKIGRKYQVTRKLENF